MGPPLPKGGPFPYHGRHGEGSGHGMAVTTRTVTAVLQGTIQAPLFVPPFLPVTTGWQFSPPSLFAAHIFTTPAVPNATTPYTQFRSVLFTPFAKYQSIMLPGTASPQSGLYFANRVYPKVNNTGTAKPYLMPITPALFVTPDLTFASLPSNYTAFNPLRAETGFGSGLSSLLATAGGSPVLFYDVVNKKFVPGAHWRKSSTGISVITLWPINTARYEIALPPWPFPDNPGTVIQNVPDPNGVGNSMLTGTFAQGLANGAVEISTFGSFASDLIKTTVNWPEASLQAAFGAGITGLTQATAFGHIIQRPGTAFEDQGSTAVLLSPDGTKYYRIKFSNGSGNAGISTAIAGAYSCKLDQLGVFFMGPVAGGLGSGTNLYTSGGLALSSLIMPTGGLQPFSLPCWTPCIPPQFLG